MIYTVALYIILGIVALFVLIFSVRVRIDIEMRDELILTAGALGIKLKILPKKPKKYNLRDYTPKKIAKRDKKNALKAEKKAKAAAEKKVKKEADKKKKKDEQAKLTKAEKKAIKAQKKASQPPLPDMISLLLKTLKFFFPGIFKKFHFHVARIKIKVGSADASQIAVMYLVISNALGPVLSFIDKYSNLHGMKRAEIEIAPDFLSEEIKADVKLGFSTTIGGIVGTVLATAFKFVFGYFKIKPSAPMPKEEKKAENNSNEQKSISDNKNAESAQ